MKILITHFRVGKTDGTSLEISKRKKFLEDMGHEVYLLSGPVQQGADFVIEEMEFDVPKYIKLRNNCILKFDDYENKEKLKQHLYSVEKVIEKKLNQLLTENDFDMMFVHNIFSLAINITVTIEFYKVIKKTKIPFYAVNHYF